MLDKFKVLRNAETYVVNRQFGRAISEYRSLLETKGEDPALLNTLGDLLLKNKEQAEALSYFRRVAQIFIESGFTNKAIAVCKKIHKLDPSDRETVGQLADLYTKRGFQSQAAKYYRQLVAESRDAGRFQEAADWQKNILTVFPGEPGPFAEMAELNLELEEANGALGNFVTASWLSFKKGAYQESVEYADQALSVDELSEAASRLKEVASSVLADGDSVLSDPAFQLDDELFASIVPFKADESETGAEEPAKESPEELVTAPRTTESSDGTGELAAKPEDDWSKSQEAVDDYSAVGEFDGDAAKEESASEAEGSDEFLTAVEAESEPEAETVHELSEDIIDNDLHDVEELLKDVARVEADSEQQPEDFGMVEGARLGELDIKVGGTVDTFERYGEVLGSDEFGETPTEPEIPESSEKLTGAQEEVSTGIDAADEEVNEHSDEGQLDSEAVEAAAAENDAAQGTPEYDRIEGLVGTDEHLQEDTSAGAVEEASPEQALASELDSGEGFEDEQSVLGVIEIPEDVETPEEPLDALVEDDELAATSVPEENDEIFEVSAEESADEVIKRLEEVPFESEGADLGVESAVSEPREDETVLEIADDFSVEDLSAVSVEDLFEEAVSAEESFDSTEESLEQTLDLDEIEEFGSKESDTAVTFQGFESFENESAVEEETVEHQTMDGSSEETVLDQEFLRKLYDDEFQSNREDLEEPKLETIEQEAAEQETVEASQEPPSFWDRLRDTVLGRSDDDEEEVADEDPSEEVFDAIETVDSAAGENVGDEYLDDAESSWEVAEVVEGVEEGGIDEQDSGQEELALKAVETVETEGEGETEEDLEAALDEENKDGFGAVEVVEGDGEEVLETEGVDEETPEVGLVSLEVDDEPVLDNEGEPEEQIDLTGEEPEQEQADTTGDDDWVAKEEAETGYEVVQAEETTPEEVVEAEEAVEAAVDEVVEEEYTHEAESDQDAGVAIDEEVVEAAEVVGSVTAETVENAESGKDEPELKAGEVVEAVADEEAIETEETLTLEAVESEEEVASQPVGDAGESTEAAQAEGDGEEITFETESKWETGEVSPEEVVEPEEAVESLTAEVVEEETAWEETPEIEAWKTGWDSSVEESEDTLHAEDQTGEESETVPAEASAEELELESDEQAAAETFEEPHSFWDKLRDAVMGVTSEGDEDEAGANLSEEVIESRKAVEGAVDEVVEGEHTYEAEPEQEVSEAVHEEVVDEYDSDREELELVAEEAEEELEAVSDEEVEGEFKADEVAEGDIEAIVEADEADEDATEVGLASLEDDDELILDTEGEPEEQIDLTGEEQEQSDTAGEDEWVAREKEETAYEAAEAEETAPEEIVEAAEAIEGVEEEAVEEEHTYEAESEQGVGEAVHAEVVEVFEADEGAVEELVEDHVSDQEELELVAEETEEEFEAVSDEEGEDEIEAAEAVPGDVEEIVEQEEVEEEESRYEITDLWKKLVRKAYSQDEAEDVAETEEVETIAAVELESEEVVPQDLAIEDESAEERAIEAQEDIDADGEDGAPSQLETLQSSREDDSAVESKDEELGYEAPAVDPEMEKSRDYRAAVTETWKQPSVYADSSPSREAEDVTSSAASTAGWKPESDEAGNGDRKQDLGSLEEALQEYDFNIKLGLREEAERLISQLLAEHAFDERVLLRAKSHGMSLPSAETEPEPVEEGEKTIEDELDSAFEDIFKMPGDEILEDVLVFELDTADNAPSDESKVQYDLGLGYREMGLLDDAIEKFEEAFQVAIDTNDRDHAANCCGMLASTYMELTEYRKVLEWADRGLGLHVAKAFEEKALQYERAQALEMLGEFRQSLDTYRTLMEQDPAFRDVRAKVGRLNLLSN